MSKLADGDYLCEIRDSYEKKPLTVRIVLVHRNVFRRRRLVTSLLDPVLFPASELARLYHLRWDIETFYRDLKQTLGATSWHCQSPRTFHQEILVHMIALCLIRIAMLEASCLMGVCVAQLSFARALTETRLLFKFLVSTTDVDLWPSIWSAFVPCCARHRVDSKPGRQFPRDRQEYRGKSRGLEKRRPGRRPKNKEAIPMPPGPETHKDSKGATYLLS